MDEEMKKESKKMEEGDLFKVVGEDKKIRCPICSSAYQHAHTPQSLFYPEDFFIPFSGECGCKWGIVFEFCKGDTLPYVRILRSCNEETKLEDRIDTLTFDTESFWKNLKLEFI